MDLEAIRSQLGVGSDTGNYSMSTQIGDQTTYKASKPNFITSVAKSVGNVAGAAVGGLYHAIADPITGLGHDVSNLMSNNAELGNISTRRNQIDQQVAQLQKSRNTMAPGAYKAQMNSFTQAYLDLSKEAHDMNFRNPAAAAGHLVSTAAIPFMGGVKAAQGAAGAIEGAATAAKGVEGVVKGAETVAPKFLSAEITPGFKAAAANVAKLPIKQALIGNPTGQQVTKTGHDIAKGNIAGIAGDTALLAGVPLGIKYIPKIAGAARDAVMGTNSLLEQVFGKRIQQFLQENPQYNDVARIMQQFTRNQKPSGDQAAAAHLSGHLNSIGVDPQAADLKTEFERASNYFKGEGRLQEFTAKTHEAGAKAITLSHDVGTFRGKAAAAVSRLSGTGQYDLTNGADRNKLAQDVLKALDEQRQSPIMDQTLRDKIGRAITEAENPTQMRHNLMAIEVKAKVPVKGFRAPRGFMVTYAKDNHVTPMPKLEQTPNVEFGRTPHPVLAPVGDAIRKAGLSPVSVSSKEIHNNAYVNFDNALQKTVKNQLPEAHGDIWKRLQRAANSKDLADPRLLSKNEMDNALGSLYKGSDVKNIRQAVFDAYAKLPKSKVGLGNWVVNQAIAKVPYESNYLRIQTLLRYQRNPFFYGRQITKSAILAMFQGGNPFGRALEDTLAFLESKGYFQKSLRDIGAADFFGDHPDPSQGMKQIGSMQKQIVGKLAESIASSNGKTVEQVMAEGGPLAQEMDHAIRVTLGYPREGYISSPLAKTLNVLVFPSRFDTKVLLAAGKAMAKLPPVSQALLVSDLVKGDGWIGSPQGKQWQQNNADLMSIVKYFTPLGTLQNWVDGLHGGVHIMDLGEIGGLPFGIIAMSLQHQGANLGAFGPSPYVDPSTGQIVPESIPITVKGRLQQGTLDLVSSMFSYPGATVGLPSKTSIEKAAVGISAHSPDFKSETPTASGALQPVQQGTPLQLGTNPNPAVTLKPPAARTIPSVPVASSGTRTKAKRTKTVSPALRINTGL